MKLKRILFCVIVMMMAVFCMTGCSGFSEEENQAIHNQLMGSWVPLNDPELEQDAEGNVIKFSVYEFMETETRYHVVQMESTSSSSVNEYTITDGKYKVITEMGAQFSGIRFTDAGNLVLYTDTSADEFRPLTQEEIKEFGIPVNRPTLFEDAVDLEGGSIEFVNP